MFNCRVCANTPFGAMFGYEDDSSQERANRRSRRHKGHEVSSMLSQAESHDSEPGFHRSTSEERTRFRPRSPEEVLTRVKSWESYLHIRAKEFWKDETIIRETLMKVAQAIDRHSDPILAEFSECVFWHGSVSADESAPVIRMIKPGDSTESDVAVTRTLVFLYADDDSFAELQRLPQQVLKMICNEPGCVNLSHIALD